jgi:hypothetical protein
MLNVATEIRPVVEQLRGIGYLDDRLVPAFPATSTDEMPALVAFADRPFDSRTASVAVVYGGHIDESHILSLRPTGAPVIFACLPQSIDFWSQGAARPIFQRRLSPQQLPNFFKEYREKLAPAAIYRAKIWGRIERDYQLDFVDAGLMPLVEEEAGKKLTDLVERLVERIKEQLGWGTVPDGDGRWLLQSTFWLLAAKILKDKQVNGFKRLDLSEVEEVYSHLARHYNSRSPQPVKVGSRAKREALTKAAEEISRFGNCACITTEALGYLYESALIDKVTRSKLGTHSTPTWLVDYIVGKLRPWIERDIPVESRRVFEPACGHAAFLISAMRLLTELLPSDWEEARNVYLRRRLHGLEFDSFALEIARLSLTLADVPNPNGWSLSEGDMFRGDVLEKGVRNASIVLGNPPFENFGKDRSPGCLPNKASETFRRVVEYLPERGVFGFVLPQTFLRSKQAAEVRRTLLAEYELAEIDLFADKLFRFGESESTVIIGRRVGRMSAGKSTIEYRRIREEHIEAFRATYRPGAVEQIPPEVLSRTGNASLFVPDLHEVWDALQGMPKLERFAHVGQGLQYRSVGDPKRPANSITISKSEDDGAGLVPGFSRWNKGQLSHHLPISVGMSLDPQVIRRPGPGATTGIPQILLNHACISRGPWRLEALIDVAGHAVTGRFNVVRPKQSDLSVAALWAILNSPVANAYVYSMSGKRDVLPQYIRAMRIPDLEQVDLRPLEKAAEQYLCAARATESSSSKRKNKGRLTAKQKRLFSEQPEEHSEPKYSEEDVKILHWRIDAEVLRLYNLSAEHERRVLDLFSGVRRLGVPFQQFEYFPEGFSDLDRLSDFLAITVDWPKTNRRRAKLIDREEAGRLTTTQAEELNELQRLADASVSLLQPVHMANADEIIEKLKRDGLWEASP